MAETIAGWKHVYSGKVRDLYESEDGSLSDLILIVASDRISAFDWVLPTTIPEFMAAASVIVKRIMTTLCCLETPPVRINNVLPVF